MNINVALSTIFVFEIRKQELVLSVVGLKWKFLTGRRMTLFAFYFSMFAFKRITGVLMVKGLDLDKALGVVTIGAGLIAGFIAELALMGIAMAIDAKLQVFGGKLEDLLFVHHMALGTLELGVFIGELKLRGIVIELNSARSIFPTTGHVTISTRLLE